MRLLSRVVALSLIFLTQLIVAQEMRRSEEPADVGLTSIWSEITAHTEDSLPINTSLFTPEKAFISATGLRGNTPYRYTLTIRSTTSLMGLATSVTEAVYYGKHAPLQMPDTKGERRRVSFYFRTAPGTEAVSIGFRRPPDGETVEAKDPHLELVTEAEFSTAWNQWRAQHPPRDLSPRPGDGQNLLRFIGKLQNPPPGLDRLLVYGIGSSYTNMLGNGERLIQWVREHFPNAPEIVYKKHVGSAVAYDFTRGWMRQLVLGEKPDLVILYSEGQGPDLEKLLQDFRSHSDADIIVASLHLRERAGENTPETVFNDQWKSVRAVAEKYHCEWVDNRAEHAAYLKEHGQPIEWLLKDAVHQSDHGALVINENIVRHLAPQPAPTIELVDALPETTDAIRVDFYGKRSANGGQSRVLINGEPADQFPAFVTTVIVPGP
ncbi:MAG: SGNH/GDSL hydrolase family protein, partial [Verrucomicrobiota bacterium]